MCIFGSTVTCVCDACVHISVDRACGSVKFYVFLGGWGRTESCMCPGCRHSPHSLGRLADGSFIGTSMGCTPFFSFSEKPNATRTGAS